MPWFGAGAGAGAGGASAGGAAASGAAGAGSAGAAGAGSAAAGGASSAATAGASSTAAGSATGSAAGGGSGAGSAMQAAAGGAKEAGSGFKDNLPPVGSSAESSVQNNSAKFLKSGGYTMTDPASSKLSNMMPLKDAQIPTINTTDQSGGMVGPQVPYEVRAKNALDKFRVGSKDPSFSGMSEAWKNKDYATLAGQMYGMQKMMPEGKQQQMTPIPQIQPAQQSPFADIYMQYGPYGRYGR